MEIFLGLHEMFTIAAHRLPPDSNMAKTKRALDSHVERVNQHYFTHVERVNQHYFLLSNNHT